MFYNLESVERTAPLFDALEKCKGVVQDPTHHPEGDVFVHISHCVMLRKPSCADHAFDRTPTGSCVAHAAQYKVTVRLGSKLLCILSL